MWFQSRSRTTSVPRVSLKALLLLVAGIGCAFTIWKLNEDLHSARQQLARFKQKGGFLDVRDESIVHAVQIPGESPNHWLFRVYVPEDFQLELNHARWFQKSSRTIPVEGVLTKELSAGEYLLSFTIRAEGLVGPPEIAMKVVPTGNTTRSGSATTHIGLSGKHHDWAGTRKTRYDYSIPIRVDRRSGIDYQRWRGSKSIQIRDAKPLILMAFRPASNVPEVKGLTPCVVFWITPRRHQSTVAPEFPTL